MPYITKYCVEKILDSCRIEEVIGDFVQLKKAGVNFKGLSPFVTERTPSFVVSPVKRIFSDWAAGKSGSVVTFLMEKEGMSYPEALEYIAKKYNVTVEYDSNEFSEKKKEVLEIKEARRSVLKKAHELYQAEFKKLDDSHSGKLEVFGHREYTNDDVAEWGIGYAPENFLYDILKSSGKVKEAEQLGLIISSENIYERYSKRVVYALHDYNGLIIGLAGRDLTNNKKTAKWINPPVDTTDIYRLYDKDKFWYGLHKAKFEIRKRGEVFIVEGYNDVIGCHKYGLENTVGSCGTAITDSQLNSLRKLCDKAVFWMDPDRAGIAAVLKQIPKFIKAGFRTEVITMDLDPDDYCRKYSDVISLSEGLNEMFKTPGIRRDGFSLLIDHEIKTGYLQQEQSLGAEKLMLEDWRKKDNERLASLKNEATRIESDLLEGKAKLKEFELAKGKKSDEFIQQQLTNSTLKANLEKKKNEVKNFTESPELKQQKKIVEKCQEEFYNAYRHSETSRSTGARELLRSIIYVEDKAYFDIYSNWIVKESGISKTTFNSWVKELKIEEIDVEFDDDDDFDYELPSDVKIPFSELERDIKKYGLFMANSKIYFSTERKNERTCFFVPLSNFEIEVLQHMADEKFPALLIRMKNTSGYETIFDCPTETFNSLIRFKDTLSRHHNFIFKGKNNHLDKLYIYLSDKMGKGVKIDVMGQQLDHEFFIFNNGIVIGKEERQIDENGRVIIDNTHYYIPPANKIYKNNPYKYRSEKAFKIMKSNVSFFELLSQAAKVHRHHYISPLLYGITCLFRDIVVEANNNFPILFLYGQGGTGKDELGRLVMSLTGIPQKPISLEAELSTQKATIRVLAQFRNGIIMFSEYKRGNQKQDGSLKGIYDLLGYSIGTIESKFSTDYIPVEAGLILTGNEFPDSEPLIQRLIWNQMDKNVFTEEEKAEMEILKDMVSKGVSGHAVEILKHRAMVKEKFIEEYGKWQSILTRIFPEAKVRIINNISVIASFYGLFKDVINFPFTQNQMIDHFKVGIEQQMFRIQSTSLMVKFWDSFIGAFKAGIDSRITAKKMVNIEGTSLFIQWTHVFQRVQMQWYTALKEAAPRKEVVMEELKKIPNLYVGKHDTYSFDVGREAVRSSAIELNLLALDGEIRNNILGAFMEQIYVNDNLFGNEEIENIQSLYNKKDVQSQQGIEVEHSED